MNGFALISCFTILGATLANPTVQEDGTMVYVGLMDGFIVLDENTMSNKQPKLPEVLNVNESKMPELITSSRPKLPEKVTGSGQILTESSIKPTTIKLPEMVFVPPPSRRPDYSYGPHPYLFQNSGYGYNPSYVSQISFGASPYAPQNSYNGFKPYLFQSANSNEFRPSSNMFPFSSYGFGPFSPGNEDQDAVF